MRKSVHVYENECCLYVGALLGVWGIIPFFCVPDWLMGIIVVVVFVAGLGCCVRTV